VRQYQTYLIMKQCQLTLLINETLHMPFREKNSKV